MKNVIATLASFGGATVAFVSSTPVLAVLLVFLLIFVDIPWYLSAAACLAIAFVGYDVAKVMLALSGALADPEIHSSADVFKMLFAMSMALLFSSWTGAVFFLIILSFVVDLPYWVAVIAAVIWYLVGSFVVIPLFASLLAANPRNQRPI